MANRQVVGNGDQTFQHKQPVRYMRSVSRLCLLLYWLVATAAVNNDSNTTGGGEELASVAGIVGSLDSLSTLDSLLELTGLVDSLSSCDVDVTLFAPTDEAFQDVPCRFLEDQDFLPHLTAILLYHVVPESLSSCELEVEDGIETLNGETLSVRSLDPIIVNESIVVSPETLASNGVVRVIDKVLLPTAATYSILDVAITTSSLSSFTNAIAAAGLDDIVSDFDSVFTVLAPSNDAFDKLPEGALEALLLPKNVGTLIDVLLFHVVEDVVVISDDLCENYVFGRQDLKVTSIDPLTINGESGITTANVLANNGIVHIIDTVLIPPGLDLRELSTAPDHLLRECEYDCDHDADCGPGLLCADEHKQELRENGLDPRKAYCDNSAPASGFEAQDIRFAEVCYNPNVVY